MALFKRWPVRLLQVLMRIIHYNIHGITIQLVNLCSVFGIHMRNMYSNYSTDCQYSRPCPQPVSLRHSDSVPRGQDSCCCCCCCCCGGGAATASVSSADTRWALGITPNRPDPCRATLNEDRQIHHQYRAWCCSGQEAEPGKLQGLAVRFSLGNPSTNSLHMHR